MSKKGYFTYSEFELDTLLENKYKQALKDVEKKHIKFEELCERYILVDRDKSVRVRDILKEFRVMKSKIKGMKNG